MSQEIKLSQAPADTVTRCNAANDLWLSYCTALTLSCLRTHGQEAIGELEFKSLRRHQHKHFHEGLKKLALDDCETDAIRCARYHYFSNSLGGRRMEYVEETPKKVWIRYRPPFWICDGTDAPMGSVAALGPEIGRGAFQAWHANNAVMLGNKRLAFVQTHSQCEGDPWEAGYFMEAEQDLRPDQHYQRQIGDWGPKFDPDKAPKLPHLDWPAERQAGALKNFAIGHTASRLLSLYEMYGPVDTAAITEHAFRIVLAARWRWLPSVLGIESISSPQDAARYFALSAMLIGDEVSVTDHGDHATVTQHTNRLWRDEERPLPEVDAAIARAWDATLRLHGWRLRCRQDDKHWRFWKD